MLLNENMFTERLLVSVTKVYRKKVSGLVAHAGLVLNFDQGEQLVLHTNPERNTHLSTIEEFSDGERLVIKECFSATQEVAERIKSRLFTDLNYSVFNNCEHLVNEVLTGLPTSEQLKTSLTVSTFGTALVACKASNRNLLTLSVAALGCGLIGLYMEKQSQLSS
jgi:hypothetical protein